MERQTTHELSQDDKKELFARGYEDPVFFLHTFLPDWFPPGNTPETWCTIPWVHRGILAIMTKKTKFLWRYGDLEKIEQNFVYPERPGDRNSPMRPIFIINRETRTIDIVRGKFIQLRLPRGFSKTTLANGILIRFVVYKEYRFPVLISETGTHADMQLDNIRGELESNNKLLAVFGMQKPERNSSKKWTANLLQTVTGITLAARGRGAQIRGLNDDGQRPDFILCDDLEDKESVSTPEQRKKAVVWFYGDVIPALPRFNKNATIVALGTLLGAETLLTTLEADPKWTTVNFGAHDRQGDLLWPEAMDDKALELERASYISAGELSVFYLEYYNTVRNTETAKFREEFFPIIPASDWREQFPHRALVIDPAISPKPGADFCAFGVVGMSQAGMLKVLDNFMLRGMSPREQVNKYFELSTLWDPSHHGVESIAYQAALIHLLREEMFRKGRYFEIEPITHSQKKIERVEGVLQPRAAAGYISFHRPFPILLEQLLDWPTGKLDGPDVVAMAITLLDPYAAQAADPSKDLGDDEYEPIENVLGPVSNWGAP